MDAKKAAVFCKPQSGALRNPGQPHAGDSDFYGGGYEVTVHPTSAPRDLTRQIAERAAGYDLVVCTGGDGTLNEAVSGLMQLPPADRPAARLYSGRNGQRCRQDAGAESGPDSCGAGYRDGQRVSD